jgi:hypothetical protein
MLEMAVFSRFFGFLTPENPGGPGRQKCKKATKNGLFWLEKPVSLYKEADADEELFEFTGGANFAIHDVYDF